MCGIAGIFNVTGEPADRLRLERMTRIISHRGPDDEGYLLVNTSDNSFRHCRGDDTIDSLQAVLPHVKDGMSANLAFGFRRLSIIDLSVKGHQPMSNSSGTLWIVFNGEIFNYIEIREELSLLGHTFKTQSDTEVILAAYEQWGTDCLNHFNGMWSFALWDSVNKKLFCARDRFGVKPFYYYWDGRRFIFGSEIKQLLIHDIERSADEEVIIKSFAISNFLENTGGTYFRHVKVLPHSHYIMLDDKRFDLVRYYDLPVSRFEKSSLSFSEACDMYGEIFRDSVRLRMRSDVEVGSALSGGLDSSAIVMLASGLTGKQFQTFSSYFTNAPAYDERKWISLVVENAGTRARFVSATPGEALDEIENIIWHHDTPVEGSSPVAQYFVMRLAADNDVTVLLDGQGSDEISGGYNHGYYRYYADLISGFHLPEFFRQFPSYLLNNPKGSKLAKIAKTAAVCLLKESDLYRMEARYSFQPFNVSGSKKIRMDEVIDLDCSRLSNFLYNQVMSTSIQTLLHYEDRNSMAHSIESRVPFLDYRLVEFVFSLPSGYKIWKHLGKYIHREALKKIVPREIMERKDKVGFLAPGEKFWLRNEWKDFALDIFGSASFRNRGMFDHRVIINEFNRYLKGDNRNAGKLWQLLMTEIWFRIFIDRATGKSL
jgi:asparagine synthase (glutamine-hydrolysing)